MLETHETTKRIYRAIQTKQLGATDQEIADHVNMSLDTIKRHLPLLTWLGVVSKQPDQRNERAVFSYKITTCVKKAERA